ncbi:terminase small subunit [Corynebacterium guaraldiae]
MTENNRHIGELEAALVASIDELPEEPPKQFGAAITIARLIAYNIDEAIDTDTETATKALYLSPHLINVMKPLGLFPTEIESNSGGSGPGAKARKTVMELMNDYKKRTGTEG